MLQLLESLRLLPASDPRKFAVKRILGMNSYQASVDKQGRLRLPEDLATAAGIKDEAVLVGMLDHLEIWNPERYEQVQASEEKRRVAMDGQALSSL